MHDWVCTVDKENFQICLVFVIYKVENDLSKRKELMNDRKLVFLQDQLHLQTRQIIGYRTFRGTK